jgi:S-adenosylmethionine:tRNA ribosyltransferase-isomerase
MSDDTLLFDYELPRELVAQEPLRNRADARLMVLDRTRGELRHHYVRDLPDLLPRGDRLVLNDTKVIPAQLIGVRKPTGGRWRGLFIAAAPDGNWRILSKTRGRLSPGETVSLMDREGRTATTLRLLERLDGGQWLARPAEDEPVEAILERVGRVPLPPYIRGGNMTDADVAGYQTVFARRPGAVAAPTAGLHFTKELLRTLEIRGVGASAVTLHVGLGTFRPIEAERLENHPMHEEWGELTAATAAELNATRAAGGRIIAVGTTVARLLEAATRSTDETAGGDDPADSRHRDLSAWQGRTALFIRPPFEFRAIDGLLTNFHFPRTTLLVLVQTFGGKELLARAYREAIQERYRFYSYGDAMLIL